MCSFAYGDWKRRVPFEAQTAVDHGLYVVSGNHRRAALSDLNKCFPQNPHYASVPCLILLCSETKDNIRELQRLGSAYNDVDHNTNPVTFKDKMLTLRKEWDETDKMNNQTDKRKKRKKIKEAYALIWNCPINTMGSHISMISKPPDVWALLLAYLNGEHLQAVAAKQPTKSKKKKVFEVKSWGNLLHTGSLHKENMIY